MNDLISFLPPKVRPYAVGAALMLAIGVPAYALNKKIDDHLIQVKTASSTMLQFAEWSSRTLQVICKSNPQINCPDVPNWGPLPAKD